MVTPEIPDYTNEVEELDYSRELELAAIGLHRAIRKHLVLTESARQSRIAVETSKHNLTQHLQLEAAKTVAEQNHPKLSQHQMWERLRWMQRVEGSAKISEDGHVIHQDFIVFETFDSFRRRSPSIVAIEIAAVEHRPNAQERNETRLCTIRTGDFGVGVIKPDHLVQDMGEVDPLELIHEARTHYR